MIQQTLFYTVTTFVFLIGLAILATWMMAETEHDRHLSNEDLLTLDYTVLWGARTRSSVMSHPVVWSLHVNFGVTVATWLTQTNPADDRILFVWVLTGLAVFVYFVTLLFRLHLVNKALVYSTITLATTRANIDHRVPKGFASRRG